eukprot:NODE_6038_length_1711_cov_2.699495.p1 GENE.NODE_6038_length_1711_cov_2.699495~~NODE_6038_length_1711_cov_2.699495.p1  ORF type:complete len:488 (-),score=122.71 NODE_6038_length_1711_cov_2.699495:167-1630(-)
MTAWDHELVGCDRRGAGLAPAAVGSAAASDRGGASRADLNRLKEDLEHPALQDVGRRLSRKILEAVAAIEERLTSRIHDVEKQFNERFLDAQRGLANDTQAISSHLRLVILEQAQVLLQRIETEREERTSRLMEVHKSLGLQRDAAEDLLDLRMEVAGLQSAFSNSLRSKEQTQLKANQEQQEQQQQQRQHLPLHHQLSQHPQLQQPEPRPRRSRPGATNLQAAAVWVGAAADGSTRASCASPARSSSSSGRGGSPEPQLWSGPLSARARLTMHNPSAAGLLPGVPPLDDGVVRSADPAAAAAAVAATAAAAAAAQSTSRTSPRDGSSAVSDSPPRRMVVAVPPLQLLRVPQRSQTPDGASAMASSRLSARSTGVMRARGARNDSHIALAPVADVLSSGGGSMGLLSQPADAKASIGGNPSSSRLPTRAPPDAGSGSPLSSRAVGTLGVSPPPCTSPRYMLRLSSLERAHCGHDRSLAPPGGPGHID